ncbi:unnamed protein product [Withania somnifera]
MRSQGIKGPPYSFPHGNTKKISLMRSHTMDKPMMDVSHDIFREFSLIFTYGQGCTVENIGRNFLTWHGSKPYLLSLNQNTYPKMDVEGYAKKLLGEALITNEGEKWAKVRKLANHFLCRKPEKHEGKEFDLFKDFGLLTTEVISWTASGSSYMEGKHIFEMVAQLTAITVKNVYTVRFPGIRLKMVYENFGTDYIGQLMNLLHEPDTNKSITSDQMIDEVKALYALHPEWQEKTRKELFAFCGLENPSSDAIARLRTMNMILNVCMILYPPDITVARKVKREVRFRSMTLPANMTIFMPILALHQDPQIWEEDVHVLKPERFTEGVAKATNKNAAAFFSFGMGHRTCVGLNFTTNEAKIALSMILQRYKLTLSPNYVYYPSDIFLLTPKDGVKVVLKSL